MNPLNIELMTFLNQLKVILFATFLISFENTYTQEVQDLGAKNDPKIENSIFAKGSPILYTINVTGLKATGINGTVSYTVGQLLYKPFSGSGGVIYHGIQNPKEKFIALGIDDNVENLSKLTIYPNPTIDYISLDVKNLEWENLSYRLYDLQGRTLENKNFSSKNTVIDLKNLSPSIYFLQINDLNKNLRSFKIIKTK